MNVKDVFLETLQFERRLTRETLTALQDGDVHFRPTAEQMPFGEQVLHILLSQEVLLDALQGKGWQWERPLNLQNYPTQQAILDKFDQVHAESVRHYQSLDPEEFYRLTDSPWSGPKPMLHWALTWLTHETHHRGQLVTYLRLKGLTPPAY